jgi:endonuclease/exonuclease/phosphatase family metal-dependent hydrolase
VKKALLFWGDVKEGVVLGIILAIISTHPVSAQVLMGGGTYAQNFDSLANGGTANAWTDNVTLPGWYASKTLGGNTVTAYRAGTGSDNTGALYSFGGSGSTDRALGSVASGTPGNFAYGVRFKNDTAFAQTNFTVSYTGEQWRVANASTQKLAFSYQVGTSLANADAAGAQSWTAFSALDFSSPNTSATQTLNGNDPTNRVVFTNVILSGVAVQPGQEIFFRWFDPDDSGSDDGLAIDNLTVSFGTNSPTAPTPPAIITQPQSQTVTEGDNVAFTVVAGGTPPLNYQWQSNSVAVAGATNDTFTLFSVTTSLSGSAYSVTITNATGSTNSQTATLTVLPAPVLQSNTFRLVHYNVKGNGALDWSTNAPQVQAIARELIYLNPDIITFNEIPNDQYWQMTNWITAFFPAYTIVVSHGTDGFIRNAIATRFPVARSTSWLDGVTLVPVGYTNAPATFTRDLFEAEIIVPDFPQHLHVFSVHLKSGTSSSDDAARRAAEASAVSNFFVTVFLATNALHPYILDGDMNEDIGNPATGSQQPIQRLTSVPTGLRLTTPLNPVTHANFTHSIQGTLARRYDYIMPCPLLFSNIASSQVFRTDLLTTPPPPLLTSDDITASDHLPVMMVFNNPFTKPFRLVSITRSNQDLSATWEAVPGQSYRVESSSNLTSWTTFADNLLATNYNFTVNTNLPASVQFFRVKRLN